MSLQRHYTLVCDMCGARRDFDDGGEANVWSHEMPVRTETDVHYELMDLCPSCVASVALVRSDADGDVRYERQV